MTGKLKEWVFDLNPHDTCVTNKITDGKQCTIMGHLYDLNNYLVNSKIVDSIIKLFDEEFDIYAPLMATQGEVHDYPGMVIDYNTQGKVVFTMFDYIGNVLNDIPYELYGTALTPACSHLFIANNNKTKVIPEEQEIFHHFVSKLLYLSNRKRPEIKTSMSYLCTRVHNLDIDDTKKVIRIIRYLRVTQWPPLTLESDDGLIFKWWVYVPYAMHNDYQRHTGATLSLGKYYPYSKSSKQKLNTKRSTEDEIVGIDDMMLMIIWTRYFMEAQGYHITDNIRETG